MHKTASRSSTFSIVCEFVHGMRTLLFVQPMHWHQHCSRAAIDRGLFSWRFAMTQRPKVHALMHWQIRKDAYHVAFGMVTPQWQFSMRIARPLAFMRRYQRSRSFIVPQLSNLTYEHGIAILTRVSLHHVHPLARMG